MDTPKVPPVFEQPGYIPGMPKKIKLDGIKSPLLVGYLLKYKDKINENIHKKYESVEDFLKDTGDNMDNMSIESILKFTDAAQKVSDHETLQKLGLLNNVPRPLPPKQGGKKTRKNRKSKTNKKKTSKKSRKTKRNMKRR
jgi:hypothetical protein